MAVWIQQQGVIAAGPRATPLMVGSPAILNGPAGVSDTATTSRGPPGCASPSETEEPEDIFTGLLVE